MRDAMISGPLRHCLLALVLLYLSLEVRRAFHGPVLSIGATGDPEFYTYSVVWLGYALALLALGIWRHMPSLRYASLAILLITVAKVFLLDMAALDGLLKVASLLGLGLSLVAIGYFYQRFVFPPRAAPAAHAGGAAPAGAG